MLDLMKIVAEATADLTIIRCIRASIMIGVQAPLRVDAIGDDPFKSVELLERYERRALSRRHTAMRALTCPQHRDARSI